ncbi:MAG: DMT family transporter [Actinobacteria bacterium]|nr:DMT family transporter [Actinomycetota bacterium]
MQTNRTTAGLLLALLGVLGFSFSLPWTVWALESFDPVLTATGRALIAGAVAAIILLIRRVPWPDRSLLRPLLYTMAGAVFGWPILIALALERTTAAHAAVIAAIMPLVTAVFAVLRTGERVARQFWIAAVAGTVALIVFALLRGGGEGGNVVADLLIVGAVLASSWCYVEGASLTRVMPGWQVISWVVVLALPLTVPISVILALTGGVSTPVTPHAWVGMVFLGLVSVYFAFFAWYKGLSMAGVARGAQTQQVQAPLTLLWSALLLGETITLAMVVAALAIVGCVAWAVRVRTPTVVAPEE